jgi:hypothetical protein
MCFRYQSMGDQFGCSDKLRWEFFEVSALVIKPSSFTYIIYKN